MSLLELRTYRKSCPSCWLLSISSMCLINFGLSIPHYGLKHYEKLSTILVYSFISLLRDSLVSFLTTVSSATLIKLGGHNSIVFETV